jgi:hypothetical protein
LFALPCLLLFILSTKSQLWPAIYLQYCFIFSVPGKEARSQAAWTWLYIALMHASCCLPVQKAHICCSFF